MLSLQIPYLNELRASTTSFACSCVIAWFIGIESSCSWMRSVMGSDNWVCSKFLCCSILACAAVSDNGLACRFRNLRGAFAVRRDACKKQGTGDRRCSRPGCGRGA